jgi:hypothetical protein
MFSVLLFFIIVYSAIIYNCGNFVDLVWIVILITMLNYGNIVFLLFLSYCLFGISCQCRFELVVNVVLVVLFLCQLLVFCEIGCLQFGLIVYECSSVIAVTILVTSRFGFRVVFCLYVFLISVIALHGILILLVISICSAVSLFSELTICLSEFCACFGIFVVVIMFFKLFSCFTVVFHEQLYIRCSVLVFVFLMTLYVFVSFQFVSFITVFAVSICVMVKYVIVHICVIVLMSVSCFTVFSMSVIFSCANFSVVYVSVIQLRSCVSIIFCVSFSVYSISVCMLFRLISGCVSSVMSCVSFSLSCLECFQELFVSSFTLYVVIQFCICLVSSLPFVTTMVLKFITVIMFSWICSMVVSIFIVSFTVISVVMYVRFSCVTVVFAFSSFSYSVSWVILFAVWSCMLIILFQCDLSFVDLVM